MGLGPTHRTDVLIQDREACPLLLYKKEVCDFFLILQDPYTLMTKKEWCAKGQHSISTESTASNNVT